MRVAFGVALAGNIVTYAWFARLEALCVAARRGAGVLAMHLHILGICGTFMGGLAAIAKRAGHDVTGCDANVYPPMSTQLAALGASASPRAGIPLNLPARRKAPTWSSWATWSRAEIR